MRPPGNARTITIAALLLAAGIAGIWLFFSPEAGDRMDFNVARESSPFGLYGAGTTGDMAPESVAQLVGVLGLGSVADYQDYTLGLIEELEASWVRIDFPYDGSGFRVPERYLEALAANGIAVAGCPRTTLPLGDDALADYESRLAVLVASRPEIAVWQIDSEPALLYPDAAAYAELFLAGRRAVAASCPDCRIALGGAPALDPSRLESLGYYENLLEILAAREEGDAPLFDIFDIHCHGGAGAGPDLLAAFEDYQELLADRGLDAGVSYWMTECATYSGAPVYPLGLPPQSEAQQAGELVVRFVSFLGAGGERVAWSRLYEDHGGSGVEGGYFDHAGLVYNGLGAEAAQGNPAGTTKEAFGAYRLLVEELDGFAAVSRLAPGQYRFDFNDGRDSVYVVWAADGEPLVEELRGAVSVIGLDGGIREDLALEPASAPVFVIKR